MSNDKDIKAPIFGISRLRMGIDGPGVTTLVTFMGCHLKCKYCINDKCHEPVFEEDGITPRRGILLLTPRELYDRVKIDNIYFQATGGGICFGGGEPGLQSEFIQEFKRICDPTWKLTIETALGYPKTVRLAPLIKVIDNWIIDVKDINDEGDYTGLKGHSSRVLSQLFSLRHLGVRGEITVKIPSIKGYSDRDRMWSLAWMCRKKKLKYVETKYLTPDEQKRKRNM